MTGKGVWSVSLALYRKYRPPTFAEVIGQDHVTDPLMQDIRTGRLHHAYLFVGADPRPFLELCEGADPGAVWRV